MCAAMEQPLPPSPSDRFATEREHEQRALAERLRRAGRLSPAENLAAGIALMSVAEEFRAAFAKPPDR
jgi:hypothetical protein